MMNERPKSIIDRKVAKDVADGFCKKFPVLHEYVATLKEATAAENEALAEIKANRRAGKLIPFPGKL